MKLRNYTPRSKVWNEDQIRTLLREAIRVARDHPIRPDGTYNYSTEAIIERVFDEYYDRSAGWRSRLFDVVIDDESSAIPSSHPGDG